MVNASYSSITRHQHGLATARQLTAAGLSRSSVKRMLAAGRLELVHEGVYRVGGAPIAREQRCLAACLAVGFDAAVSHRAAAAIHGVWSMPDDHVELTVPRATSPELDGVIVHRLTDLTERWVTVVDGLRVTSPARTLVDAGAVLPLGHVSRMLDRAIGTRRATLREVEFARREVSRQGRAGAGVIRLLLAERLGGPVCESVLQARMLTLMRRHGLPEPVLEHTILDDHGGFVATVDFAYPELKYAIEVDGYEAHAGLREFAHDRVRQNEIVDLGWLVHRFTWREVDAGSVKVAKRIRAAHRRILGTLHTA